MSAETHFWELARALVRPQLNIEAGTGLMSATLTIEIEATYYPFGKCLKSVSEAPEWVAERIISAVQKLYPQKIKRK